MENFFSNKIYQKKSVKKEHWFFITLISLVAAFYLASIFLIDNVQTSTDVPTIITYQGKLFENDTAVTTTQSMSFVIYDASTGGNVLYTASGTIGTPVATQVSITPDNGIFSIDLGATTTAPITNSLDASIFKTNASLYLEVWVDDQALSPRKRLTTSPFSFNSQYLMGVAASSSLATSEHIPVSDSNGYFNLTRVGINTTNPGFDLSVSGTAYIDGNVTIGDASSDIVSFNSHVATDFIPESNQQQDLGVFGNAWKSLYVSGTAYMGGLLSSESIDLGNDSSDTITFYGSVDSNILPDLNFNYSLGQFGNAFSGMYASGTVYARDAKLDYLTVDRDVTPSTGDIDISGNYLTNGSDYAEYFYTADTGLEPGDVVCVDISRNNSVKKCKNSGDNNVMGIISTHPSVVGNNGDEKMNNPNYVIVGMIGQVPTKVMAENGSIRIGDSLTSASAPGYARRADVGDPTVGIALENLNNGTGMINVLISRRNKSLTVEAVEEQITDRITEMEIEDEIELLISGAIENFDLDDDVISAVNNQIDQLDLAATISAEVDQKMADINIGKLIQDEMNDLDIVAEIETNLDNVLDVINVAGFVEQAVESTFLHSQARIDELVKRADATDIILSELSAKDQEFENYFENIETEIAILQGKIAEALQGSVDSSFNIKVEKDQVFNEDTIGQAKILAGSEVVRINFADIYQYQPIITITLRGENALDTNFRYIVVDESIDGFTIKISESQEEDIEFNWHAFATNQGKIYVSDNTVEDIEIVVFEPESYPQTAVLGDTITVEPAEEIEGEIIEEVISPDQSEEEVLFEEENMESESVLSENSESETEPTSDLISEEPIVETEPGETAAVDEVEAPVQSSESSVEETSVLEEAPISDTTSEPVATEVPAESISEPASDSSPPPPAAEAAPTEATNTE